MDISLARKDKVINARRRTTLIIAALLLALCVAVFLFVSLTLFALEAPVNIRGNALYSTEEIEAVLDLEEGKNLFYLNTDKLEKRLEKELPYIENANIEKDLPHTLNVYIDETKEHFVTAANGGYCLLSKNFKVLDFCDSVSDDLIFFMYSENTPQELGAQFKFDKSADKEIFVEIYSALDKSTLLLDATEIDFTDKYDIAVTYKGDIRIKFGDYKDFESKATFAVRTIKESLEGRRGTFYVSSLEKAYFSPDR